VRRPIFFVLITVGVLCLPGLAGAQIHPATSALAMDSTSLAPALPAVQPLMLQGQQDQQPPPPPPQTPPPPPPQTAPPPPPQIVYGEPVYDEPTMFQAYIGYTWTRFEAFGQNLNGFQGGLTFFWHEIGLEGQYMGTLGTHDGFDSRLTFAGGGAHIRFRTESKTQPWVHVLVGESHYSPQTAFGGRNSFAWEAGVGADYAFWHWISLRVGADVFGTQFFHSNQYSPIVHGGIVFNF
jgi:hypothetical protein